MIYHRAIAPKLVGAVFLAATFAALWWLLVRPIVFGRNAIGNTIANVLWRFQLDTETLEIAVIGVLALLWLVSIAASLISAWTTRLIVNDRGVIVQRGVFLRQEDRFYPNTIASVNYSQGLMGAVWDFGDIEINTTGNDALALKAIARPRLASDQISHLIAERAQVISAGRDSK